MVENKRITIFKLYKNKMGGTEKCVQTFSDLITREYTVEVVSAIDKKEQLSVSDDSYLLSTEDVISKAGYFMRLLKFVKNTKSNILVSTDICTSVFLIIINIVLFKWKKIICWEHVPYKKNSSLFRIASMFFYLFTYRVVVLSISEKDNYPFYLQKKIKVIYNAVILPHSSEYSKETKSIEFGNLKMVSIGRLSPEKGFNRIIEACIGFCIINAHIKIELNLVGEGPLREELEQQISKLQLDNLTIKLHGVRFDIEKVLSENDIYVSGSLYECLPTSVIEAQIMGLPVVSFENKYGTKEVISDSVNGYLVSNVNEFNNAIKWLQDEDVYENMSKASLENSKRFFPEISFKEWELLLNCV